jgi:serine/threonine protein kinase
MSEGFVRCAHCGQSHNSLATVCPTTGKSLRRTASRPPPPRPPKGSSEATGSTSLNDLIGTTIGGKYLVRAVLGRGGMGAVYEAQHMTIGRSVAVKVLHRKQMRKQESVKRFHHEARAAGAIGHPNICEVYDLGTLDDGRPYLVMERLVGKTLADRIREEGGLPFDDVIDILVQVLSGLVAAHGKGILHRDIKPENVFLTERVGCSPVAKLLDFGVSKVVGSVSVSANGENEDLTRTGMVMGTPYYMSPEQARGERDLDGRVDMYACGVLGYEAVTGRRPFQANNYNTLLLQILSAKLRPPWQLRPDLPPAFSRVIEKAMSRKREDRYQSAAEFQQDLQRLRAPVSRPSDVGGTRRGESSRVPREPRPVAEILSDRHGTPSSLDIPVVFADGKAGSGEVAAHAPLADFSLPDDDDAATMLMRDDEIEQLTKSAQRSSSHLKRAKPQDEVSGNEVTKVRTDKSAALRSAAFNPDETEKMDRDDVMRRIPSPRRTPKGPR